MLGLFGSTISRVVIFGHFWISDFGQPQRKGYWWIQRGSNSLPRRCERRALPDELWTRFTG